MTLLKQNVRVYDVKKLISQHEAVSDIPSVALLIKHLHII